MNRYSYNIYRNMIGIWFIEETDFLLKKKYSYGIKSLLNKEESDLKEIEIRLKKHMHDEHPEMLL